MHFLDLFKFTTVMAQVIQDIFENCGYQQMVVDLENYCKIGDVCHPSLILTNLWWRSPVITFTTLRILINIIEIITYVGERDINGLSVMNELTTSKLYDIGNDFGNITRYISDFHLESVLKRGEFDSN